jgi:hypothetical protein
LAPVTAAPVLPRLRITEVLARPHDANTQEFVEVINEGPEPASLEGLLLATSAGTSRLPAVTVHPGQRAVIVGAAFDPRGSTRTGSPIAPPGTTLVRLDTMLATRGLADKGSRVWLADAQGHILSLAPGAGALRSSEIGVSLVRADPRMAEDDLASWSYDALGGSTPGLPDRLR